MHIQVHFPGQMQQTYVSDVGSVNSVPDLASLTNTHKHTYIHKHMYVRVLVRNVRWQGKVREGFYGGAYLVYVNLLLLPGEVKETRLVLRGLHMVESSFCSTLQDPGKDTSKYVEDQEVNRCSNKFGHLDR